MKEYTLAYSESAGGWTSFYSYYPEMMIGMNSHMYSFKDGNLYKHSDSETRNTFYGEFEASTITAVINEAPSDVKTFKTIVLESTDSWSATFETDLETGYIDESWFSLKEGDYFAYIRNNETNLSSRESQGVGSVSVVTIVSPTETTLTFTFNVGSMVSVGDLIYNAQSGTPILIGTITGVDGTIITVDTTGGVDVPLNGNYIMYGRNSIAESSGLRGYYMQYKLENESSEFVEIYGIGSSLFKSYP